MESRFNNLDNRATYETLLSKDSFTLDVNGIKTNIVKYSGVLDPLMNSGVTDSILQNKAGVKLGENILPAMRTDRFQLGGVVDNVLDRSGVNTVVSSATSTFFSGMEGAGNLVQGIGEGVGSRVGELSKTLTNYISPVADSLKAFSDLGKKFDEMIKDTFLVRVFKLKGQEILCIMFCIVVSFIPCEVRNKIYKTLMDIRSGIKAANDTISEVNRVSQQPIELPVSAKGSVAQNVASLFGGGGKELKDWKDSFTAGKEAPKVSTSQMQVPDDVKSIIKNIVLVLTLISKGQISLPVGISANIWSLTQAVMYVIRMMMIQMVDEFLTKVVGKVEAMLKKIVPMNCIGNIAANFINKIMQAIRDLKNYLMELLKGLFGDSATFAIKWKKFGWYFKSIGDLLAMLKALQLILAKFPDLVIACGITPCDLNDPRLDEVRLAINNGNPIPLTNIPADVKATDMIPEFTNLDDIARNFAGIINVDPGTVFIDNQTIKVTMPDAFKGAPKMIRDLVDTPEFLSELGNPYTVYKDNGNPNITIVYSFNRMCGE